MRPIHMAAMAAAMMPAAGSNAMEFKMENDRSNRLLPPTARTRARFSPRAGGNQRQRRKDRRRLHAAGSKKAFLG